jgi:uncharacterized protein YjbI with pentapeptide repeats
MMTRILTWPDMVMFTLRRLWGTKGPTTPKRLPRVATTTVLQQSHWYAYDRWKTKAEAFLTMACRPWNNFVTLSPLLSDQSDQMTKIPSMLLYSTLHYATLRYSTLLYSTLRFATLCYASLLYATLRFTTLRYASLCFAMLRYALLCFAMLRYASLCFAMLRYASLLYATLRFATLRYSTLLYATLHYYTLLYATLCALLPASSRCR